MSHTVGEQTSSSAPLTNESTATKEGKDHEPIDSRSRWRDTVERDSCSQDVRVLVVTGLGHKNERHYGPLAAVAEKTTLVCLDPTDDIDNADYVQVPEIGPRILRVVLLFFVALYEGYRNEYDAVASISLLPYGLYALALKAVYGYPAHLGIIGIDLDHHAQQWYGAGPQWAFRRFDAVSVPGSDHAERLVECGVSPARIEILTNAIDIDRYRPVQDGVETDYDFVWVGRFGEEKDPIRFVRALAELDANGHEFTAAMVGDGQLRAEVIDEIERSGLADRVDLTGWVDDPRSYYRRSETFVLTSRRDALPLAMLEAMASGLAPIVPRVGSVPDVVTDGHNGLVVPNREPTSIAAAMERCLDEEFREHIATNATAVRSSFSMDEASADWYRILSTLEG